MNINKSIKTYLDQEVSTYTRSALKTYLDKQVSKTNNLYTTKKREIAINTLKNVGDYVIVQSSNRVDFNILIIQLSTVADIIRIEINDEQGYRLKGHISYSNSLHALLEKHNAICINPKGDTVLPDRLTKIIE